MDYNPNIIEALLASQSTSYRELAGRLGLGESQLRAELDTDKEPKRSLLNSIAGTFKVPPFIFYMERLPNFPAPVLDFRSDKPAATFRSPSAIKALQFAESVQRTAAQNLNLTPGKLPHFKAKKDREIEELAYEVRSQLGITAEDQISSKDTAQFYTICRKKIEDFGIFVLHDSFDTEDGSGFCLSDPDAPVILINTKRQTRGRRLFTLIHELAHVLMNKTGFSDPFVQKNEIERRCNRFAGSFLVPKNIISELIDLHRTPSTPDPEFIRRISSRLKISQEASALRLEQIGVFEKGTYSEWKSFIQRLGNPDKNTQTGGGGPTEQYKVKLAKYGFHFADVFSKLLNRNLVSEIDVYRASGLKPKYAYSYFEYTKSLKSSDLFNLELMDE
ncbi:ImmA/IrrE family metallo-endopeptidase [Nisaea denitrificans]|uniref:ImmA/IrrE family metallo-endopeptidase n=1 Tax=Nisaea denitrificans TaxID=390877 RepID=UPI000A05EF99|nr:ImmA/IrrE family metallo-endopeptidase [Nisaea denitrificans]